MVSRYCQFGKSFNIFLGSTGSTVTTVTTVNWYSLTLEEEISLFKKGVESTNELTNKSELRIILKLLDLCRLTKKLNMIE